MPLTPCLPAIVRPATGSLVVLLSVLLGACAPLPVQPDVEPRSATVPAPTPQPPTVPAPQPSSALRSESLRMPADPWNHQAQRRQSDAQARLAPPPELLRPEPMPSDLSDSLGIEPRGSAQQGLASWYGPGFHGRLTANGERFDSQAMTAAHRTYAFGTRVCVRSAVNGRTVVVRINDRGPFAPKRIIDLSQGAAEDLGLMGLGIKPVEIWRLEDDELDCPSAVLDGRAGGLLDADGRVKKQYQNRAKASAVTGARKAVSPKSTPKKTPSKKAVPKKAAPKKARSG